MARIRLRDCPMCGQPPTDESGPCVQANVGIDLQTGEQWGAIGYTAFCMSCGTTASDEYLDEVVRLWNASLTPTDPNEDGA